MATLIRQIEPSDIPQIEDLLTKVFGDAAYCDITRLGGMTNHSYKITRNDKEEYLVRLPGEGTEELLSRSDEQKSTELACRLGIDSELLYFGEDGKKVMKFIKNPQPIDNDIMKQKKYLTQAAQIFQKLHNCGEDTCVRFEVFEMAGNYEKIIQENQVTLYDDYFDTKNQIMEIKAEVDANGAFPRVPCHNDCLIGNWVLDENDRLWLIDWEYSGMNEAMWDLSCLSIELDYSRENDLDLLSAYYNREVSTEEEKHFVASKLYVDFLWTLWGLTRVPYDGDFMQSYADERYKRLKNNIDFYQTLKNKE